MRRVRSGQADDGRRSRRARSTWGALALATWLPACLVTNEVDYEAPNNPPMVGRVSPNPFWQLLAMGNPDCATSNPAEQFEQFVASISDVDVDQRLEARLIVNRGGAEFEYIEPVPDRRSQRADLKICVDQGRFQLPCNHVELIVTGGFSPDNPPYNLEVEDDYGKLEWLVVGSPTGRPDAKPSDCAALFRDAGVP